MSSKHQNKHSPQVRLARASALAAAFVVGACATPDDMRAREPTAKVANKRPAAEVATCIADRWDNTTVLGAPVAAFGLRLRPTAAGHIITVVNGHGGIVYMADVLARSAGSETNFYDYLIPDPTKVHTGMPAAYSVDAREPFISRMHKAVIACSD